VGGAVKGAEVPAAELQRLREVFRPRRPYWRDLVLCALAISLSGVGCHDMFPRAGEGSALGNWDLVLVAVGFVASVWFCVRHRAENSVRVLAFLPAFILAMVAGRSAREPLAAAVWDDKCGRRRYHDTYCYDAVDKYGFFEGQEQQLLGRQCIGSEYPYVMCRYMPSYTPEACAQMSRRCTELSDSWRGRASLAAVCATWTRQCALDRRASDQPANVP